MAEEPSPEFAAMVADNCDALLNRLEDERLVQIAQLKMQGYTNDEIAKRINRSRPTVERRLKLIREIWRQEGVCQGNRVNVTDVPATR